MKLIELHILQSFPVACLNRDDVGSPKTAIFGGVERARISSQALKRATREYAQKNLPNARFGGQRTKLIVELLRTALQKNGVNDEAVALKYARMIADKLAKLDPKDKDKMQVGTLTFLAPSEIEGIAGGIAQVLADEPDAKAFEKELKRLCKKVEKLDAADIAVFGRMAASMPSLTLEGAAMFSHALSTHKSVNELDFFSAVDDLKPEGEDAGAGMIGTVEFVSALYYRYAALNLDILADADHLGGLSREERQGVVDAFIRATLLAVPGARKNSMNANTLPSYVFGTFKKTGQPVQLVNAFESPVRAKNGLIAESVERLQKHYQALKDIWGITCEVEVGIPDVSLNAFCEALTQHVI